MTKDEVLALCNEWGAGAYDSDWEQEGWFEDLVKDREVARAMIEMSDGDVIYENVEQLSWARKDKELVLFAMERFLMIWSSHEEFERSELWDFPDISLHQDQEIKDFIGEDSPHV